MVIPNNGDITISETTTTEALYADHKVLNINYLNYGGPFKLKADVLPKSPGHSMVTFIWYLFMQRRRSWVKEMGSYWYVSFI
jgi:hypothetical protein